jgi:spermidine synthase
MTETATVSPDSRSGGFSRRIFLAIAILFLVSGATGLIYQVVWTRMFTTIFGNTTYAVSAVLSSFMAGLALGSGVFGRIVDRKERVLRIYALLEIGIGVSALAMPSLVSATEGIYSHIYLAYPASTWILTLVKSLIAFSVLIVPTFLMGATLPVLSRFLVQQTRQVGSRVGLLYAINTLGATAGCLFTGFYLILAIGVRETVYLAAALNFVLAICFFLLDRIVGPSKVVEQEEVTPETRDDDGFLTPARIRVLLIAFGCAGFCSLAYEVLWFRVLVFQMSTTVYSFALMLAVFLTGIALGSGLFSAYEAWRARRSSLPSPRKYWRFFGYLQALIALLGLSSILLFSRLDTIAHALPRATWEQEMLSHYLLGAIVMLVPATLMGIAFPVVCRIASSSAAKVGASVGGVYAANTVGCIFGPLATGFLLVPWLGTQGTIVLVASLNALISVLIFTADRGPATQGRGRFALPALLWVLVGAGVAFIPGDVLFQYYNTMEETVEKDVEIVFAHEGLECVTTVHRYPDGSRVISTGAINVAGTAYTLRTTQLMQAHVPMLLHPDPQLVCQIGFGSGETSHIVTSYGVDRLDLVDISEGVLTTSARFFTDINHGVVDRENFNAIIMDGANYLRMTDQSYDVIMNDSIWPFLAGNNALYTQGYFEAGRDRLRPGGFMTSWLPLTMTLEDFKILLRTFHDVFPHVQVWIALTHRNRHCLIVGSLEPMTIDAPLFLQRFERYARKDLEEYHLGIPTVFLSNFLMDETALGEGVLDVPLNTDNHPILEFSSANQRSMIVRSMPSFQLIARNPADVASHLVNIEALGPEGAEAFRKDLAAASRAASRGLAGMMMREDQDERYIAEFEAALVEYPGHPGITHMLGEIRQFTQMETSNLADKGADELLAIAGKMYQFGADDKAEEALLLAKGKNPTLHNLYYLLGVVQVRQGRIEEGIASLEECTRQEPEYAAPWNNLGSAYARLGRMGEAVEAYRESLRLDPDSLAALGNLGNALVQAKRFDEGIETYRRALEIQPGSFRVHLALAKALARTGRHEEALEGFERVLELRPDPHPDNHQVRAAMQASRQALGR